ncbi:MAG: PHP domain-containing protein [Rikenellaceae bacterium]|nr:PHP domain-containing protein [Rikenellaceae bacterium]
MIKADLHIHTILSPCGDIEMTPSFIIKQAKEKGINIIAITDHNSTRQCEEVVRIGKREGVSVLCGAEITTREEVHVLALVDYSARTLLQEWIDAYIPQIPNNEEYFGYQLVVNEMEEVLYQEPNLLISALNRSIDQTEEFVHSIGGLFIPAHIDKPQNSLISQLGFVPPGLKADALELSSKSNPQELLRKCGWLKDYCFLHSSDAHYPSDFGDVFTFFDIEEPNFESLKRALKNKKVML